MKESSTSVTPLVVVRIPSPVGPIVRCQGSLTFANAESLRRDLALLIFGRRDSLIVNVSGVRQLDPQGALALVDTGVELARAGGRLVLVAEREPAAGFIQTHGIDRTLEVCPSEDAALALLSGDLAHRKPAAL
jgi:anti-anti-sigma regulatory factor